MSDTAIRLVEVSDAEALAEHRARDRAEYARWDPQWPGDFYTVAGQRARTERRLAKHAAGELWPAAVLSDGVLIGEVTVQDLLYGAFRRASLGYWIGRPYAGRGHATRAVGLIVELMVSELRLHRAEASVQLDNLGSQHVLRANGFTPYGVARDKILTPFGWRDELLWERILD